MNDVTLAVMRGVSASDVIAWLNRELPVLVKNIHLAVRHRLPEPMGQSTYLKVLVHCSFQQRRYLHNVDWNMSTCCITVNNECSDITASEVKRALHAARTDADATTAVCAAARRRSVQRLVRQEPTASLEQVVEVCMGGGLSSLTGNTCLTPQSQWSAASTLNSNGCIALEPLYL